MGPGCESQSWLFEGCLTHSIFAAAGPEAFSMGSPTRPSAPSIDESALEGRPSVQPGEPSALQDVFASSYEKSLRLHTPFQLLLDRAKLLVDSLARQTQLFQLVILS